MSFCYCCGHQLELKIPEGDDQQRECCPSCDYIHYVNPRILVSCMVYSESKLLWIRRGLEPAKGLWAMPAGFVEKNESLQQAAIRELQEETGLELKPEDLKLCVLSSLTFINEVYVVFRCRHPELELTPPSEEIEALGFLEESEVNWQQLAYPETESYMRDFYREMDRDSFEVYLGEFSRRQQALKKVHNDSNNNR